MKNTGLSILTNFMWRFAERCGAQGVQFVVSIVLARLLMPEAYGTVALIGVFTSIMGVFVNCGLNGALIQKKDTDDLDYSTVFFFGIGMSVILYLFLWGAAPWIAAFYEKPELVSMVRVIGIGFAVSALRNGQTAYISKNMLFKKYFYATLGGTILSALVGIGLAYCGFGAWALVGQTLSNSIIDTS